MDGLNRLKLNTEKTQIIWLGTRQRLAMLNIAPVRIHNNTVIQPSISVRSLGVIFVNEFTMTEHVSSVTQALFTNCVNYVLYDAC